VQGIALCREQQAIEFALFVSGELQVDDCLAFEARQFNMLGKPDDVR